MTVGGSLRKRAAARCAGDFSVKGFNGMCVWQGRDEGQFCPGPQKGSNASKEKPASERENVAGEGGKVFCLYKIRDAGRVPGVRVCACVCGCVNRMKSGCPSRRWRKKKKKTQRKGE